MIADRGRSIASAAHVAPSGFLAAFRTAPWPLVLLAGTLAGLVWGIDARLWMRFISTDPEFTWSGTLFIVIGFGIAGLSQSGAYLGRRAGLTRPWMTVLRVFTFIGLLPLGMAAGGQVFPTVVLATVALTHTEWSNRTRLVIAGIAAVPVLVIVVSLFDDLSALRAVVGVLWFLIVYAGIVWAARFTLAPHGDGWRAPLALRIVGIAALLGTILFDRVLIGAT